MTQFDLDPARPGRLAVAGAPEGHQARLLGDLAQRRSPVLHVALDDAHTAGLAQTVAFFAPDVEIVGFPAWDCLPYDRVSPNPEIIAARIDALMRLLAPGLPAGGRLVLTTVNALLQRVPPRTALADAGFAVAVGDRIDIGRLQDRLARQGYARAKTVREPGEYAVRGGIVDLYPPGTDEPLRLDLFGDVLEAVRVFDPISQRTTGRRDRVAMAPMSELFLDAESIARFRSGYRALFGAMTGDDPLYEAVSAGRKHAGMEHWLPLFHPAMETLFDYLPDAVVTLDHQIDEASAARHDQISDFHEARRAMRQAERRASAPVYRPLPPDRLYLDQADWTGRLAERAVAAFSPFAAPAEAAGTVDAGGRRGRDFADARAKPEVNLFDAVRQHTAALMDRGKRVVIAGYTLGARERLRTVLQEHGMAAVEPVDSWQAATAAAKRHAVVAVLPVEAGFVAADMAIVTEQDIFGDRLVRRTRKRRKSDQFIAEVSALSQGDLVVHVDHGIGRYEGLETLTVSGAPHDCLRIAYADTDKLFLPVENIELLSRYGSDEAGAQLDKLG
ncbi:MAG: CarD family transcriptional regulator, partial [Alphaproteobacteria bacterium]